MVQFFFDPPRGQVVKKCFLAKALFAIYKAQVQAQAHTDFDRFCVINGATRYAEMVRVRVRARRAPNVGPKGPSMPSAGARRRGP